MLWKRRGTMLFIVASLFCNVYAQDTKTLDEVMVTAQKQEENIQKVPISMNIVDEFLIEDKHIQTMEDLTKVTPSLSFVNQGTSGVGSPTMRGLHGDFHNFNTPTVIFVDGVPILNGLGYNTAIFDVQRVEVLKGPQGTLYGKNSEAGVINIISKKPSNTFEGKVALSVGSDKKRELNTSISGPIIEDKLYVGVAFKTSRQEGFLQNTFKNEEVGKRENRYGKVHLRATPTDNLDISFISSLIQYDDEDSWIGLNNSKDRTVQSDLSGYNKSQTYLNALNIQYHWNELLLESITSYRKYKDDAKQDWDLSNPSDPNYMFTYHENRPKENKFTTLAQELRLSGEYKNFKWLTGLYLDKDKVNFYSEQIGTTNIIHDPIDSSSIGVFGHVTYDISDNLSLLGGIRYDREKKEHTGFDDEQTYKAWSPKIALNYNISDDSMAYINIAQGYRAGGFNTSASSRARNLNRFDQEKLTSYEVGMKNQLLDDTMLLNFALYYMDISDMQVKTALSPFDGYTSNAGEATSKGIEMQLEYKLNSALSLFGSLGVNKVTFDDFKDQTFDMGGTPTGTVNYKGNDNIYSPKYNYNVGLSYRNDQGIFARADVTGFGSMYTDKQNNNKVDAYKLVDAKIGYEHDSYEIYLYGKNIFDKEHNIEGYNNDYIIYSKPREIGVQFVYRF